MDDCLDAVLGRRIHAAVLWGCDGTVIAHPRHVTDEQMVDFLADAAKRIGSGEGATREDSPVDAPEGFPGQVTAADMLPENVQLPPGIITALFIDADNKLAIRMNGPVDVISYGLYRVLTRLHAEREGETSTKIKQQVFSEALPELYAEYQRRMDEPDPDDTLEGP